MEPDWRTRHCAEPVVEAIDQANGRDVWAELGGCPRGWRQAASLYRRTGCKTLADVVTHVLGEPIPPRLAMRGDIVMINGALGICRGELAECIDGMAPMAQAERAWRVTGRPEHSA